MRKVGRICTALLCPLLALASIGQGNDVWVLLALLMAGIGAFCGLIATWRESGPQGIDATTLNLHR